MIGQTWWKERLFTLMFLMLGIVAFFHPTILSGFTFIQTDPGDTRFNNYVLEHCFQWISGNPLHSNLWDCPIFYPLTNTASYSDILIGSAPIYWIWRILGFLPDTSFQLWMITVGTLNFLSCLLFLRQGLHLSSVASVGGSYLFSFASMRGTQLNYPQLLPQFFTMIALYCLCKMFGCFQDQEGSADRRNWAWTALFTVALAGQALAGIYLGFFLFLGLSIALGVSLAFREPRRYLFQFAKINWLPMLISAVMVLPVLGWMAYHYNLTKTLLGARPWSEVALMIPTAKSWIDMGPWNQVYHWLRTYLDFTTIPNEPAHRIGVGLLTTTLSVLGMIQLLRVGWGKIIVICTLILLATAFVYSGEWSPWILVFNHVPAGDVIRVVTRVSLLILVGICVSVAYFLHRMKNSGWAFVLLFFVCAEQYQTTMAYNKYEMRDRIDKIVREVPTDCRSFYCVFNMRSFSGPRYWAYSQLDAMWAQLAVNIPTVNGFSGNIPPGWAPLSDQIFFDSPYSLLLRRINVFQWADLNGLSREDIRVVPVPSPLQKGNMSELSNYDVIPGNKESNTFFGPGWGEDERHGGEVWTWAVARQAKLFVPLLPGVKYIMSFTAAPMSAEPLTQRASILLNGRMVATLSLSNEIRTYEVTLPKELVQELNKIEFEFDYAVSPASLGKADDTRELAMALYKMRIVAAHSVSE
ncbi:MAG: hypothetical protein HY912_12975 [Desulfomonile tiedjei]|uniref:Uncharacterized protein n=1 Tax=Desulfomonile tiedjei TaxID=2358 RepID=A0A9D6V1M0_9BACT|nr:hypothetical protein [Desulfomonile tiedjei]